MKNKISRFIKFAFILTILPISERFATTPLKVKEEIQRRDEEKSRFGDAKKVIPEVVAPIGAPLAAPGAMSTTFNMKNYFQNLTEFSAINNIGSCGFVSLTQAMSYFDAFFSDHLIPEQYDRNYTTATTEAEVKQHSPGILRQSYYASTYGNYYSYVHATADTDLQSRLTLEYNIEQNTDNPTSFQYSIGAWDYEPIINNVIQASDSAYYNEVFVGEDSVSRTAADQEAAKEYIKQQIDQGIPVIVHILVNNPLTGQDTSHHSVVAYDYDENNIYANYGWGASYNHVPLLGTSGYNYIYYLGTLNLTTMHHDHSNNYIINGEGYPGCNGSEFVINTNADNPSARPYFRWGGTEDYLYDRDQYQSVFFLRVYDNRGRYVGGDVLDYTVNGTLVGDELWRRIQHIPGTSYFVEVESFSDGIECGIFLSRRYEFTKQAGPRAHIIRPDQYGFDQQYHFAEITANHTIDGLSFQTKRLRTGFIQNEWLVMSPRRAGAGVAYLQYTFNAPIHSVGLDLSAWSDDERLAWPDGVWLEYKEPGNNYWYSVSYDLDDLKEHTRGNPIYDLVIFYTPVTEIRFYSSSAAIGSSKNTGRTCIGTLDIVME